MKTGRSILISAVLLGSAASAGAEPKIPAEGEAKLRIEAVLAEMQRNYGGTMVCDPEDAGIDSPAFVERYLEKFGTPGKSMGDYDYRFERLLARVSEYPKALEDARLDEPVWKAYEQFERSQPGKTTYQTGNVVHSLDSARDLFWIYLGTHAEGIKKDAERRKAWMERLLAPASETEELARSFAALQLVSAIQKGSPALVVMDLEKDAKLPAGRGGLDWFADKVKLTWTLWGADPESLPAPRIDELPSGKWTTAPGIDQESWSEPRGDFQVSYFRPVGQRDSYYGTRLPVKLDTKGVFFLPVDGSLQIWPKKDFRAGVICMLRTAGFLTPEEAAAHAEKRGLKLLEITARSAK